MSWLLYGVKTAYRSVARGRPRHKDSSYDPSTTLVEERVVLIRARSAGEAVKKAEVEARSYVRGLTYRNVYGEKVRPRFLGACDAYELFDRPDVGAEVFSTNRLFPKRVTDRAVIDQVVGPRESRRGAARRWRYLDHSITLQVLGNRKTKR